MTEPQRHPQNRIRHRIATRLAAAALAGALLLAPAGTARAAVSSVDDAQKQLDQLNQQIRDKQGQLQNIRSRKVTVQNDIRRITGLLRATTRELSRIQTQMKKTQADIVQAQADLAVAEADLNKRQHYIDDRVRAMYENGSVSYLEVLLGSRDFVDFLNRLELLTQIVSNDVQVYGEIKDTHEQIAQKKAVLEDKQAQLTGLKQQSEVKKASLDQNEAQRQKSLTELASLESDVEDDLDQLEQASNELTKFIQANSGGAGLATDRSQIHMAWPVPRGRITSPFGYRVHPILRTKKLHTGIDIADAAWTPIKAAEAGRVIMARYNYFYGYMVMIDHGAGVVSLYGHGQKNLQVKEGDMVTKGRLISYVGSTGMSTGPHLHFEVRVNGTPVSPTGWLPK
ncbi:MAG: murein hydrolase activator EnvC family protein [Bacillota bacterium]